MFDFNWPELLIIATVALIVIGPEDLPDMFRQLGRFTAKLRQMSREFSRAMEQAAKETGVKDVVKDLKATTSGKALGLDAVKDAADRFEKWDPMKNTAKPSIAMPARSLVPPVMPATPVTIKVPDAAGVEEIDDLAEADDDLAAHAESDAADHGPATQALYDKQALRAQVLKEQTEKLKAIEAGTYQPAPLTDRAVTDRAVAGIGAEDAPAPKKRVIKVPVAAKPAAAKPAAAISVAAKSAEPKPRKTTRKTSGKETA